MAYGRVRTVSTQQQPENSLDKVSNSGSAVRLDRESTENGLPENLKGEVMQYLVAIHHPDDFDPSVAAADEAMERDIDALNEAMIAAGVRMFAGGLQPVRSAKSLRAQPHGGVLITDGPYLETKEHIGGFWVLEAADMDEALEWGRKAVIACRTPVEVRPFF
jgi:hypothetical protein